MSVLAAAVIALAIVVLLNLLLTVGVIRRLRLEAPERPALSVPRVGMRVPNFSENSTSGDVVDRGWIREQSPLIVGFFAPDCPACARLKREIRRKPPQGPFLAFVREDTQAEKTDPELVDLLMELATVVQFQMWGDTLETWDVNAFPTLLRVENGFVTASGHTLEDVSASDPSVDSLALQEAT